MLIVIDDFPVESSGHFNQWIFIKKTRTVKGRFSKSRAVTLLCCSRQFSWYEFSLVNDFFNEMKQSSTFWTPFTPPRTKPGNLKIFDKFSRISIGIKKNEPINVSSKILTILLTHPELLKTYGSKSPWANFMPIIQLYYAMKVATIDIKQTVIASW